LLNWCLQDVLYDLNDVFLAIDLLILVNWLDDVSFILLIFWNISLQLYFFLSLIFGSLLLCLTFCSLLAS
jgi:hypothetical protein